jgi:hypothetical protein
MAALAANQDSRYRLDPRLAVQVRSVPGGLHHEYALVAVTG